MNPRNEFLFLQKSFYFLQSQTIYICQLHPPMPLYVLSTELWMLMMQDMEENEEGVCDQGALPAGSGMTNGELSRLSIVCPDAPT